MVYLNINRYWKKWDVRLFFSPYHPALLLHTSFFKSSLCAEAKQTQTRFYKFQLIFMLLKFKNLIKSFLIFLPRDKGVKMRHAYLLYIHNNSSVNNQCQVCPCCVYLNIQIDIMWPNFLNISCCLTSVFLLGMGILFKVERTTKKKPKVEHEISRGRTET